MRKIAISCMSGGYKGAFIQGVLVSLEHAHFFAEAYASCSSSSLPAAFASFREASSLDLSLWIEGKKIASMTGNSQSNAILNSIATLSPFIKKNLFQPDSARYLVAASYVKTQQAALETQTERARGLGRKLLVAAARKDASWKDEHLELHLFDTRSKDEDMKLIETHFEEVAYATTRMLHAWHIPAYINNKPYIDGSYTTLCPVFQLAVLQYTHIVAILTEQGTVNLDFFSNTPIPEQINSSSVLFIKPDVDLKTFGVDFFAATDEGIALAYQHGLKKGKEFIEGF
ncbi:MAG: hypothetical protein AABY65_05375 [Nitrospirota bacterium]